MASNGASTTTQVIFNAGHLSQPTGILRLLEIFLGLLCWALTAQIAIFSSPHQFVMFVSVTSWIIAVILLLIYLFSLNTSALSSLPWTLIELGNCGVWSLFYFIASIVSAAYTYSAGQLIAATIFAFMTTGVYATHAFLAFRAYQGASTSRSEVVEVDT